MEGEWEEKHMKINRTREKIWEAVRLTGCKANETARELRKPKSPDIYSERAIDCILARELDYFLDPFLSSVRRVLEEEFFKSGYHLKAQFNLSSLPKHAISNEAKRDAAINPRSH